MVLLVILSRVFHTPGLVMFASLTVRNMWSPDGIVCRTSPFLVLGHDSGFPLCSASVS